MEYKYRMLNPPHSTESIDFKLSETYLENCLLRSPAKAQDSLTYTVSMETIQDHDYSPFKNYYQHFLHPCEQPSQSEIECPVLDGKTAEPYNLHSQQPIVSIRIEPDPFQPLNQIKLESILVPREANEIGLCQKEEGKEVGNFIKKRFLKINNIELEPIEEEAVSKRSRKMGKVMTRIHSQIKQSRTIGRSRATSRKTLKSPGQEAPEIRIRAQSAHKVQSFEPKQEMARKNSQMSDKINESTISVENLEEGKLSGSTLTKTNSSSNGNCSPQLIRRKSDYTNSNYRQNSIFLSDRSVQKGKRFKNFKEFNPTTRERVYSTLVPSKNLEPFSTLPKGQQKCIFYRNPKHKEPSTLKQLDRAKILSKLNQNGIDLTNSISISAIKLASIEKTAEPNPKNVKKSLVNQNNYVMETDMVLNGLKGKKGWRKVKENIPRSIFCL